MAVGFKVKYYWYQIGRGDFLHSFFSTVAYNLENENWGSRFPIIMNELYQGKMSWMNVDKAIAELNVIKEELQAFSPDIMLHIIFPCLNPFVSAKAEHFRQAVKRLVVA